MKYLFENETTGANIDQPETIEFFQKVRSEILDPYTAAGASKFMVAENWTDDRTSLKSYMNSGGVNGFQATMDIDLGKGIYAIVKGYDATAVIGDYYSNFVKPVEASGGWTFSYLSNHDNYQSRPASEFYRNQEIRLSQALQMSAWGTPILYYGNEIAMLGQNNGDDRNMRTDFEWTKVVAAKADTESLLNWQKTLNNLRASRESSRRGYFKIIPAGAGNLAILRNTASESTLLFLNMTSTDKPTVTADLTGQTFGAGLTTLVGDTTNTLNGNSLTLTGLKAFGIRVFVLEKSGLANLRGSFDAWGNGLAMTEVANEPGHFVATLTPTTGAISTGVEYKFDADSLAIPGIMPLDSGMWSTIKS